MYFLVVFSLHLVKVDLQSFIYELLHEFFFKLMMICCSLLDLWHQRKPPNILSLFHWWKHSCSPSHHAHFLFLPLWHQWKRELPLMISPPLCSCCATHNCFSVESYVDPFGEETTPNLCQRYSKVSLVRSLVKIYAIYSFIPMYSNLMFLFVTCSHRKWNLIGIWFVLKCLIGFLDMFIVLVLS